MKLIFGVITTRNAGLVSDDDKLVVLFICMPRHIENPIDEVKVLAFMNITVVMIDYAITVKKDGRIWYD